jgi:ATP-binding cassette subfamily B protein
MDGSRRLAWLEDYARRRGAAAVAVPGDVLATASASTRLVRLPGTTACVLRRRVADAAGGAVVASSARTAAGKTTLVKLLAKMYEPPSAVDLGRRRTAAGPPAREAGARRLARVPGFLPLRGSRAQRSGRSATLAAARRRARRSCRSRGRPARRGRRSSARAGLDTQLGPTWPGGVEVVRPVAEARARARFMRERPLLLALDEPTAALDAENRTRAVRALRSPRRERRRGRITILVSHRFSTVRMADLIVVLAQRRRGRHHEELDGPRGTVFQLYASGRRPTDVRHSGVKAVRLVSPSEQRLAHARASSWRRHAAIEVSSRPRQRRGR